MKKILFIASESINLKSGGGLANKAFFDSLWKHFPDQVDIIQLCHSADDKDKPHFYFVPALSKLDQLLNICHGHFHRLYAWMPGFLKEHGNEYSHCVMNQSFYGDLFPMLHEYNIKVAVIHHNYEVRYQLDNKLPATLYGLTPYFIRRNERMALSNASLNLYLTESDHQTLNNVYSLGHQGHHEVIGIYEHAGTNRAPIVKDPIQTNVLAICGSLNNKQTEQSIMDVFERYYQTICDVFHDQFRLIITGRDPGEVIKSAAKTHHHVSLIPNPERIDDVLYGAGIFLCPVNCGSGMKLRIMDGMRLGLPILTHQVSAQGYEHFISRPWFRIYNDETSFRKGLEDILQVINNRTDLREEIINEYNDQFSFVSGDKRFMKVLTPFLQS